MLRWSNINKRIYFNCSHLDLFVCVDFHSNWTFDVFGMCFAMSPCVYVWEREREINRFSGCVYKQHTWLFMSVDVSLMCLLCRRASWWTTYSSCEYSWRRCLKPWEARRCDLTLLLSWWCCSCSPQSLCARSAVATRPRDPLCHYLETSQTGLPRNTVCTGQV